MDTRDNILKELAELFPTLAQVPRFNVYSVPAGYFEFLGSAIMQKVIPGKEEDLHLTKANPYSLSSEYFQQLPLTILNSIKENALLQSYNRETGELKDVGPLVEDISRITPYRIPVGYFKKGPDIVAGSIKSTGKVIPLFKRLKPFQYAAAAIMIAILATGVLFLSVGTFTLSSKQHTNIQNAAGFNPNDLHILSAGEIADFLQTHALPDEVSAFPATIVDDEPVETHLQSVPDSEIQQYLKENPEPGT